MKEGQYFVWLREWQINYILYKSILSIGETWKTKGVCKVSVWLSECEGVIAVSDSRAEEKQWGFQPSSKFKLHACVIQTCPPAIFGFSYFDFYQKHCTSIYVKLLNSTSCKGEVMPLSCLRLLRWSIFASTLIFIQFNVALPSFRDWFVMILLTTRLFVWQHYSTQISPWATCSWWSMSVNYLDFNDRMNFDVQCSVV